jgi:hypothetical protein
MEAVMVRMVPMWTGPPVVMSNTSSQSGSIEWSGWLCLRFLGDTSTVGNDSNHSLDILEHCHLITGPPTQLASLQVPATHPVCHNAGLLLLSWLRMPGDLLNVRMKITGKNLGVG